MKLGLIVSAAFLTGCATLPTSSPRLIEKKLYETTVERDKLASELADCKEANRRLQEKIKAKETVKTVYVPVPTHAINEKELEEIKRQAYDDATENFKKRMRTHK